MHFTGHLSVTVSPINECVHRLFEYPRHSSLVSGSHSAVSVVVSIAVVEVPGAPWVVAFGQPVQKIGHWATTEAPMKGFVHNFLSKFSQAASSSGGQTATVEVAGVVVAALECKVVAIALSTETELVVGRSVVATWQPVHFTGHNRVTSPPMNAFVHNSIV